MIQIQEPLFKPLSTWTPPSEYPRVGNVFGFDLETRDPDLLELGPSSIRGGGYPVGISLAQEHGDGNFKSSYFPWAHEGGGNMDKGIILRWIKPILEDPNKLLIGHNLLYEMEWMAWLGIDIKCQLWDTQIAEALLFEESRGFKLEDLCQRHLGYGKNEEALKAAASQWGFSSKKRKGIPFNAKSDLWRLPAKYVGSYAESDAVDPIKIYHKQKPLIEAQDLGPTLNLEHKLLPVIWAMRKRGVRVDMDRAEQVNKEWSLKEKELYASLRKMVNHSNLDSVWANEQIAAGATKLGISYPRTKDGNPSFVDAWLSVQAHPYWKTISDIRGVNKLNDTFIRKSILENAINGRIHCQFHPMQREEGGTRSGRLSCSNPNLQQAPNPEHSEDAWKVRSIFVPEIGEEWGKLDYSQQEPRLVVHYGCLEGYKGAAEAAREYANDVGADFYQILVKLAGITRPEAKKLYLGRSYGMGKDKLARSLGISIEEAEELGRKMDGQVPFIKLLFDDCVKKAKNRGWVRTIGGRRAHFDAFEPTRWATEKDAWTRKTERGYMWISCREEEAKKRWGNILLQRCDTHKSMNRLIQGSAADQTKMAMVVMFNEGICPLIQLHDDISISFADRKVAERAKEIMETVLQLKVPCYADLKIGPNWGEAE